MILEQNIQVPSINPNAKTNWHIENTMKNGKLPPLLRNPNVPVQNVIQHIQIPDPQLLYSVSYSLGKIIRNWFLKDITQKIIETQLSREKTQKIAGRQTSTEKKQLTTKPIQLIIK